MEQDLAKSLVELIDQTIAEIEELKKSDRFSATEIKLEGPGEGIAGKCPQGKLGKEEEDEEEKKKKEAAKKAEEMEKGVLDEADPGRKFGEEVKKEEDEEDEEDEDGEEDEDEEKAPAFMKKSEEEMDSLMKSMIDERVKPLENKIDSILDLIKEIADAPVSSKSVSYRNVTPLAKSSDEEVQSLNKSEVASKLLELKKSGTKVDTMDITQAELGSPATLQKIVAKYNIK